ncbi:hypothetical protein QJQ45_018655, partial [Haematococcus lacustris]
QLQGHWAGSRRGQGAGLGQQGGDVAREVGGSCAAGHPRRHEVCFLLDAMLGRLCRWLRCLGVDADMVPQNLTRQQLTDMAVQASAQGRIFLTRDSSLVVRRDFAAAATFLLTSSQTSLQLQDVAARWGLTFDATKAMTRCSICNGAEYETLSRMQAAELQVPAKVLNSVDEFYRCRTCHKVVWMGPKASSCHAGSEPVCRELHARHAGPPFCGTMSPPPCTGPRHEGIPQRARYVLLLWVEFLTVGFVECSLIFSGLAANRLWAHSPRAMANPKAELKTELSGNSRQQSGAVTASGGVMQLSAAAPVLSAGSNFAAWRRKAKGILILGGCWDAVEGRDSDPATCSRAYAWLLCQCNDHYGSIVEQGKTAAGAWKALLAVNAKQSYGQRQQLWRQFVSFRMEAGETITQLYCRLADLCTELNDAGNEIPEQQQIGCLLEALPHTVPFQIAKQALTNPLLDTPPSLAAVQQYLLGVEGEAEAVQPAQLAAMHVPRKPMGVGGAGSSGSSSKQPAAKPAATPAPDDARHANVTCFRCGKKGHIARNCREPGAPIAAGDSLVSSRRLWLADSGASHHITPERALLHDFRPVNQPVQIVLGKSTVRLVAYGLGSVHLTSDSGQPFTLRDVLWAPDATANYMSTVVADLAGWRVVQEGGRIRLEDRASPPTIVSGKLVGRSYQLWCTAELVVVGCEPPASLQAATAETPQLLHERSGHLTFRAMAEMVGKGMMEGVGVSAAPCNAAGSRVCPGCQAGKAHRYEADTTPSLAPPVLVLGGKITKEVVFDELSREASSAETASVLEVVEEGAAELPQEDPLITLIGVPQPGPVPAPAPTHMPVLAREAEAAPTPDPGFLPAGTVGAGGGHGAAASAGGDGGGASAAEVSSLCRSARLSQQQPEYGSSAVAVAEGPAVGVW